MDRRKKLLILLALYLIIMRVGFLLLLMGYYHSVQIKRQRSRKRKRGEMFANEKFVEMIQSFMDGTQEVLTRVTNAIDSDNEISMQTKRVHEAVCKVPDLSAENQILVSYRLVDNPQDMACFLAMNDEYKATFVRLILDGSI